MGEKATKQRKILVVEDNSVSAYLIKDLGEHYGYCVEELMSDVLSDILKNLEVKVRESQPDIAVVDSLEGECFRAIKIIKSVKPNTFCVIYTGIGRESGSHLKDKGVDVVYEKDYKALFALLNARFRQP